MVNYIVSSKNKDFQINRLKHFLFRTCSTNQWRLKNRQGGVGSSSENVLLVGLG